MSANTVVNATAASWDTTAAVLRPYFAQGGSGDAKTFPYATCESISYTVGPEPGVAMCRIPLRDVDDDAPAVAAVATSPAAGLRMLGSGYVANCEVSRGTDGVQSLASDTKVFHGLITKISHEFGPKSDFANVRLEDPRWLLKRLPIIGRWERNNNTEVDENYATYRQGWPAWPNQYGQPNAVYNPSGKIFVFCAPRMGLSSSDLPPSPSACSTTKATWWTDSMFMDYLHFVSHTEPNVVGADKPPYTLMTSGCVWPQGMSAILKDCHAHAKSENYEGKNLAEALSNLARHAGAYDITMCFTTDQPVLGIVRTKYKYGDQGITIRRADTGNNIASPKVVIAGDLSEDADQLYSKVTVAGALVFVEHRVSGSSSGLVPAWSAATSGSGLAHVNARLATGATLSGALASAFAEFPDWYGAWKLNPDYDFTTGVSALNGFSVATVGRPIADRILTSYIAGSNTDASETSDRTQWRRPVLFEYKHSGGDNWVLASAGDGMQVDVNGIIRIHGLRDISDGTTHTQAYYCEPSGTLTEGIKVITGNLLRATVAIPCDHRIWYSHKHPSNPEAGISVPKETYMDEDRIEPGVTGGHAYMIGGDPDVEGNGTFRREYRASGWPIPESVASGATNTYTDGVIWEDTGALTGAAARQSEKLMRLRRGGSMIIPHLSAAYCVGQIIGALGYDGGEYPVRAVITKITWSNTDGSQRTVLGMES